MHMHAHTHTHWIMQAVDAAIMANGLHCINKFLHDTSQQINTTTWAVPPSSELLYSIKNISPLFCKWGQHTKHQF